MVVLNLNQGSVKLRSVRLVWYKMSIICTEEFVYKVESVYVGLSRGVLHNVDVWWVFSSLHSYRRSQVSTLLKLVR
jgi:hypothetical protein